MKKSRNGFTIVELLVVIVVIGILATIVIISYNGVQARSRDSRRQSDIGNIIKAMELYYSDHGSYPIPTGPTNSAQNQYWFSSADGTTGWPMLKTALVGGGAIDTLPTDPLNTSTSVLSAGGYQYSIYVNPSKYYCGAPAGQMYIIVYRTESATQQVASDGPCTTTVLNYSTPGNGISQYRSVKEGL